MEIAPTGLPSGKTVLRLDHVTGGHDLNRPVINDLSLTVTGPERIVIAGPNGSGKNHASQAYHRSADPAVWADGTLRRIRNAGSACWPARS